ncbi:imidazole glycerol phosphate synthase subunit HisH [Amylibacter sp.]|jgi:glutamine amidotransferase|nr:imidazole glycerol phosphate synthase subunit HisH [Rhodobacterales bacterium]MDA7739458.1 imidazole glycerol phosphate synthase subunit HisH [Amylibacter sp.]MBT4133845.1 imidazole glycerol phosphate synthase subunit HisH [Rhodobacterales bacterium]MBT4323445.1 imidazole glycerol phosphate synthase subunit HisH [Rhodobacterales bacterium]MBT4471041.1 imidazole glycerol phosphate synthase subunit HisH [Rhodobacterales bacterium]|tara:strand:+ start:273 stop:908 length:636 start_codon:yes stop_codon:yes gene_type:complete
MTTVIIDYNSGNLRSAEKSFQLMSEELNLGKVKVSNKPEDVVNADRVVLPGVGAFADCKHELSSIMGLYEAIEAHVKTGKPFMGICVGMQMMATCGHEHGYHEGFNWIKGDVKIMEPNDKNLKIPHMGWNNLNILNSHPVFNNINENDHVYFVHSYHFEVENNNNLLANVDYGGKITAAVAHENIIGTQFHPEKSQSVGLQIIKNFLQWNP